MFQLAFESPLFALPHDSPVFAKPLFRLPRACQGEPGERTLRPFSADAVHNSCIKRLLRGRPLFAAYAANSPLEPFAESRPPMNQEARESPESAVPHDSPASAKP